jgi:uncharacterized iron-regulated membrane protein
MRPPVRKFLLPLHRWTGLCAGLFFLLVALTGASMAFRPQLESVAAPSLLTAPACTAPLPLDELVARARQSSPQAGPLKFIRIYDDPSATVRVRFDDDRWIYVDPCSGKVAGSQALYGGFFGTLGWLHIFGFAPGSEWVAGTVALLFASVMLGVGATLWWPATLRALRFIVRGPRGLKGRAFSLTLHKTVASYAAPVLLASALTGIPQAFGWGQAPALPTLPSAPLAAPSVPLEQMWRQALVQVPRPQKTQIRFGAAGTPLTFEMVAQFAPHANALSYVRIDTTGRIVDVVPHAANRILHKAYLFAAALHYGWIGGVAGQLLLLLGALGVPVLAWTGVASFLASRRSVAARSRNPVAALDR